MGVRLSVSGVDVLILGRCHQNLLQDESELRGLWLKANLVPVMQPALQLLNIYSTSLWLQN